MYSQAVSVYIISASVHKKYTLQFRREMILHKVLFPIFLLVTSALPKKDNELCSKFSDQYGFPLVKCQSEKPVDDYHECYDLTIKELLENMNSVPMYWCWSREDNSDDVLKDLKISAGDYDNSMFNDIINRPFTAKFYNNGTHLICHDNEEWSSIISGGEPPKVLCPTNTGIPVAVFEYFMGEL